MCRHLCYHRPRASSCRSRASSSPGRSSASAQRCGPGGGALKASFCATLRQIAGTKTVELPLPSGTSAGDLLRAASAIHPALAPVMRDEDSALREHIRVFVNGHELCFLDGLETVLPEGAIVDIFPPVAGG